MLWLHAAIQHLIPTLCMLCESTQTSIICKNCLSHMAQHRLHLGPSCSICALPVSLPQSICAQCQHTKPYFDHTLFLDHYREPLRTALHFLKYQNRLACAAGFATLWNQIHDKALRECDADVLIPAPLSQAKLVARGFNQSWEIAKRLQLPRSVIKAPHWMMNGKASSNQASLTRIERSISSLERFQIKQDATYFLEGKHVIVVDDVMTTGSTMNAMARCLKHHGVKRVTAWAFLRTLPKQAFGAI